MKKILIVMMLALFSLSAFAGTTVFDAITLTDVLTFSDGATIDNTAAATLTIIEDNIVLTGDTSVTSTNTFTVGSNPVVLNVRKRVSIAQINAGYEILPAIAGRTYRMIQCQAISYGGAVGATTSVDLLGTQSASPVDLVLFLQGGLTQSAVLVSGGTNATVAADGASYAACDTATAITVLKDGSDLTTATGVDFILTYVIE